MDWKTSVSTCLVWRFLRYERLVYQHLFYESQSQFRKTHQHNYMHACIKILQHYCKMWEVLSKIDFDIQKMIWHNASTIIWKSMTTFDQDHFWYPGTSWRNFVEWKYIQGYHFKCALHCSCLWNLPITVLSVSVVYYKN
jgi:hypothetical protein